MQARPVNVTQPWGVCGFWRRNVLTHRLNTHKMSTHNVDQKVTLAMLTFNIDTTEPSPVLSSTQNYFPKTIKPGLVIQEPFLKIVCKTIKTDSVQPCLGHTRSTWRIRLSTGTWLTLNSSSNSKSSFLWTFLDTIDQTFCCSQTSNYVEDEPNPRQPSFAFRDFYSGRRWYNPF